MRLTSSNIHAVFIYLGGYWTPVGEVAKEKALVKASSVAKRDLVAQLLLSLKHHPSEGSYYPLLL